MGWLRSSSWIVEGVLDILIVLEFFFPSCAPFNMYTCGNNLPTIDESVNCMNRVTRVNKMTRVREYFEITTLGLDEKWIEVYVKVEHFDWSYCQSTRL